MKNRLLEDFGDSQSAVPLRPLRRVQAAPTHVPSPPGEPETLARQRAGVWRSRAPLAPQSAEPLHVEPGMASIPPVEPRRTAPRISPEFASFSSAEPDWSRPLPPEPPPWTERWGPKALGWTIGLAALVAAAGTASWMVQDTQVESTLAVVADHTPAQTAVVAPALPAAAPASSAEAEPLPPLKLLSPEPVAPVPAQSEASAPIAAETESAGQAAAAPPELAPAPAAPEAAAAPAVKKPAAKRAPQRRVAAAAVEKGERRQARSPAPAREPVRARSQALPTRSVQSEQPDPQSPLAETLRLCRAAGYHATACLKRGCEATRFGLVCRG